MVTPQDDPHEPYRSVGSDPTKHPLRSRVCRLGRRLHRGWNRLRGQKTGWYVPLDADGKVTDTDLPPRDRE